MAWVALPLMLYMGEMQEQVPVHEQEPVQVPYRCWELH